MGETKLLNRVEWLKTIGFSNDPFLLDASHAEQDSNLSACYVDRSDVEYLIGDFNAPGYRLIFSKTGGGKSGIRKRIHWEYEKIGAPKVLILDYVRHAYPSSESIIYSHVDQIIALAKETLEEKYGIIRGFRKEKKQIKKSPKVALKLLVKTCQNLGFTGIYLLVDNVSLEILENIAPLALFGTKGLIIKFFLRENLILAVQSIPALNAIPRYIIRWNEIEYVEMLNQRITGCLAPKIAPGTLALTISALCEGHISKAVQDCFVKIGKLGGGPALMWEFGSHMLDKHIGVGRIGTELIDNHAFEMARLELFDSLLSNKASLIDYPVREQNRKSGKSDRTNPKAKVFLHCIEDDNEIVVNLLYHALLSEDFYPWMEKFEILPGQERKIEISKAIASADFFIPCFSVQSISEPGEFQVYLKQAIERSNELPGKDHIFIIPFRLDNCDLPDEIKHLQHVNWFHVDYLEKLYAAFKKGLKIRKARKK